VITFNADEIFEMAEQIERNGAEFYRKAAASASEQAAEGLEELANMEDEHEQTFADMRSQLAAADRAATTFDPEGEGALYLDAMVQGEVFDFKSKPADLLTGAESLADVYRTAIGLEKDSIIFYLAMKEIVPADAGQGRITDIIDQEMGHIAMLSKRLAAVR
jgi:rubrerythrin